MEYNSGNSKGDGFDTDSYFNQANILDDIESTSFPRIYLEELNDKEKRQDSVNVITKAFHEFGFCFVSIPKDSEMRKCFDFARETSKNFFDQDSKIDTTMKTDRDIGYHDFTTVKEFFQVKKKKTGKKKKKKKIFIFSIFFFFVIAISCF